MLLHPRSPQPHSESMEPCTENQREIVYKKEQKHCRRIKCIHFLFKL